MSLDKSFNDDESQEKLKTLMEAVIQLMLKKPDASNMIKLSDHNAKVRACFNPLFQHLMTMEGYSQIFKSTNATLDDLYRIASRLQLVGFGFWGEYYLPVALVSFSSPLNYLLHVKDNVFRGTNQEIRDFGNRAVDLFKEECTSTAEDDSATGFPSLFDCNEPGKAESVVLSGDNTYRCIKRAFDDIYGLIIQHTELDIAPKGLDDIPAVIYTVADMFAFFEKKDRQAVYNAFMGWLLTEYYNMGIFGDRDALQEYVDQRIGFYASLHSRKIKGLWVLGDRAQFERIIDNPIRRIAAAFIDCLIDPTYIDDYDRGEAWGNMDILRSMSIAETLLMPVSRSLDELAKAIMG